VVAEQRKLVTKLERERGHTAERVEGRKEEAKQGHHQGQERQDGHASEREGASGFKRHHLARSWPVTVSHGGA
jgi:hypothetical protein